MGSSCCTPTRDEVVDPRVSVTRSAEGQFRKLTQAAAARVHLPTSSTMKNLSSRTATGGLAPSPAPAVVSPRGTTSVSLLVRGARFSLRPAQLREAQQRLPSTSKYLAWHLIYDSVHHGGLSPSILHTRCAQCLHDATGILSVVDASDEVYFPAHDTGEEGTLLTAPAASGKKKRGSRRRLVEDRSVTRPAPSRSSSSSLPPPPSASSSSSNSRRRQRRCVVLVETECMVAWHASGASSDALTPDVTRRSALRAAPLFRLGMGLYLEQLPLVNGAAASLRPRQTLLFTFLVPQMPRAGSHSVSRPLTHPLVVASGPAEAWQPPSYVELDDHAGKTRAARATLPTSTFTATTRVVCVPHTPQWLPEQVTDESAACGDGRTPVSSSPVSVADVNITAHPDESDGDEEASTPRSTDLSATDPARALDDSGSDNSEESVFSVHETVVVLHTHSRVGRSLACCRAAAACRAAAVGRTSSGRPKAPCGTRTARQVWPAMPPIPVKATKPASSYSSSSLPFSLASTPPPHMMASLRAASLRCTGGVSGSVGGVGSVNGSQQATWSSVGPSASASVDDPSLRQGPAVAEGDALLSERGHSFVSDMSLTASFSKARDTATCVVVSPTSTAVDTAGVPSRALSARGVSNDFSLGPAGCHERGTSLFPTPPSTTTNTLSLGMEGSAGDMYSPFSATSGHSPMNAVAVEDDLGENSPLLQLRFFPAGATNSTTSSAASRADANNHNLHLTSSESREGSHSASKRHSQTHKSVEAVCETVVVAQADGTLSVWSGAGHRSHSSRKKSRKGASSPLDRVADISLSPDLTEVTLNLRAPLFAASTETAPGDALHSPTHGRSLAAQLKLLLPDVKTSAQTTADTSQTTSQGFFSVVFPPNADVEAEEANTSSLLRGTTQIGIQRSSFTHAPASAQIDRSDVVCFRVSHLQLCAVGEW